MTTVTTQPTVDVDDHHDDHHDPSGCSSETSLTEDIFGLVDAVDHNDNNSAMIIEEEEEEETKDEKLELFLRTMNSSLSSVNNKDENVNNNKDKDASTTAETATTTTKNKPTRRSVRIVVDSDISSVSDEFNSNNTTGRSRSSAGPFYLPSSSSNNNKTVSFNTIKVQEYPVIPGDNPSVMMGVPLTIDWDYINSASCTINDYESYSGSSKRRTMVELRIPSSLKI